MATRKAQPLNTQPDPDSGSADTIEDTPDTPGPFYGM